jgi:hypothetical protein
VISIAGAALVMMLTVHQPLLFTGAVWWLAVLLACLGLYSASAMLGGKM